MIARLMDALEALGLFGDSPYSERVTVTVTNLHHVSIITRSDKALKVITEALEAAASASES